MQEQARQIYESISDWHDETYDRLSKFKDVLGRIEPEAVTDIGYFFRECAKYAEAIEKEFRRMQEICSRILGARSIECGDTEFEGQYATSHPDVKLMFEIPGRDDPRYAEFLRFLGMQEHPLFSPSWKRVQEHLNMLVSKGVQIPESLDKKRPDFSATRFIKRRTKGASDGKEK